MIFDEDVSILNQFLLSIRPSADNRFHDTCDPEVDRYLNSSPLFVDNSYSFEAESHGDNLSTSKKEDKRLNKQSTITSIDPDADSLFSRTNSSTDPKEIFREVHVEKINRSEYTVPISSLSLLLASNGGSGQQAIGNDEGKLSLTIYFPDETSIKMKANDDYSVEEIIRKALQLHKQQFPSSRPPINYDAPSYYELRMHEGDGEPDLDFPAFQRNMKLKSMNDDQFCLCEAAAAGGDDDDSDFGPQTPKSKNRKGGAGESESEEEVIPDGTIVLTIPNVGQMRIIYDDSCKFIDLLPKIALRQKLRLFTDDYTFKIPVEEQARLKLMSNVMNMNDTIQSIGAKYVELHRRIFADSIHVVRETGRFQDLSSGAGYRDTADNIQYTEATATAYQEWNVVKRNLIGRKQERVIGIDGKIVYNSKRGQFSRNASGVHRAQREISSIRNVDVLPSDRRTFRITWVEKREVYDYEYSCESVRDCAEIVAKLKYLLNRS